MYKKKIKMSKCAQDMHVLVNGTALLLLLFIFLLFIKSLLSITIIIDIAHVIWYESCVTSLRHMPHVGSWVHHVAHGGSDNWTPCRCTTAIVWPVPRNWRSWSRHTWLELGRCRRSWRNWSGWRRCKTRTWVGWMDTWQLVDFSFLSLCQRQPSSLATASNSLTETTIICWRGLQVEKHSFGRLCMNSAKTIAIVNMRKSRLSLITNLGVAG